MLNSNASIYILREHVKDVNNITNVVEFSVSGSLRMEEKKREERNEKINEN
jgi:hypothetical protein